MDADHTESRLHPVVELALREVRRGEDGRLAFGTVSYARLVNALVEIADARERSRAGHALLVLAAYFRLERGERRLADALLDLVGAVCRPGDTPGKGSVPRTDPGQRFASFAGDHKPRCGELRRARDRGVIALRASSAAVGTKEE